MPNFSFEHLILSLWSFMWSNWNLHGDQHLHMFPWLDRIPLWFVDCRWISIYQRPLSWWPIRIWKWQFQQLQNSPLSGIVIYPKLWRVLAANFGHGTKLDCFLQGFIRRFDVVKEKHNCQHHNGNTAKPQRRWLPVFVHEKINFDNTKPNQFVFVFNWCKL